MDYRANDNLFPFINDLRPQILTGHYRALAEAVAANHRNGTPLVSAYAKWADGHSDPVCWIVGRASGQGTLANATIRATMDSIAQQCLTDGAPLPTFR